MIVRTIIKVPSHISEEINNDQWMRISSLMTDLCKDEEKYGGFRDFSLSLEKPHKTG